jgi:hydrogenase expression/formation protein HypE
MSGAQPLYLSCSLILEEGYPLADLQRILQTMKHATERAGVQIVTGDTKVVNHGKGDGVFINTAGIGVIPDRVVVHAERIVAGDCLLINSDLGRHGAAVMLERDGLDFSHGIVSDCADLSGLVQDLIRAGIDIHCLRDLTRGGLAAGLIELATAAGVHMEIVEQNLPVHDEVNTVCSILGLDPLYIANEGAMVVVVAADQVDQALAIMRGHPSGRQACPIGQVLSVASPGMVSLQTTFGVSRVLDLLSGEQLPRIC